MKKVTFLAALLCCVSINLFSQTWSGNQNSTDFIFRTGKTAIVPLSNGLPYLELTNSQFKIGSNYGALNQQHLTITQNSISLGCGIPNTPSSTSYIGRGTFSFGYYTPTFAKSFTFLTGELRTNADFFSTGKIIIGSGLQMPTGYKLYVEEGILTEKLKVSVKNTTDWSDFVFAPTYTLRPIYDVETFIKTNNHLPDVPSAQEVVETGINVAEMDALLLMKIEELTLYIIQLQKQLDATNAELELLKQ